MMVEKKLNTLGITWQITFIPRQGHKKQVLQIIGVLGDLVQITLKIFNLGSIVTNTNGIT